MPAGALPQVQTFVAPPTWQAIDFVSDLHLSATMPRTCAAFAAHLRGTTADAVFILGDLFDAWVGDDLGERPFERDCLAMLAAAARQRPLFFMAGNRDFLVGSAALQASGMARLDDPTRLRAWGRTWLLTHGDALCLDDLVYQAFRRQARTAAWRQDFLARSLEERLQLVAQARAHHRQRHAGFDPELWADVDAAGALAWLADTGADDMIHGHTHRPGSVRLDPGHCRHVLSDWDLEDASAPRAQVLRLQADGLHRQPPVVTA